MTGGTAAKLYTTDLLALAVAVADYPLTETHLLRGESRSRTCGSTLTAGFTLDSNGAVDAIGLSVSACAVGQAAAAIFAQDVKGRTANDIAAALELLEGWLAGNTTRPAWRGLEQLEAALPHAGRHGAIVLPWKAAVVALCNEKAAG